MTKAEALNRGYCNHCAAHVAGRQLCGIVFKQIDRNQCSLDPVTQERFRVEHGLDQKSKSRTGERYR